METKYSEAIDALFKDHLDGKEARVKASGLNVEGSIEGRCRLQYKRFFGLTLYTPLQWNSVEFFKNLRSDIYKNRENLDLKFTQTDLLIPFLERQINSAWVVAGGISPYNVKNWQTTLNEDGSIRNVVIEYTDGNKVEIQNIKPLK